MIRGGIQRLLRDLFSYHAGLLVVFSTRITTQKKTHYYLKRSSQYHVLQVQVVVVLILVASFSSYTDVEGLL